MRAVKYIGPTLLITGGTGSLGNAIVEHIYRTRDTRWEKIIIYSRDERKQEDMAQKYMCKLDNLRFLIGDIRDKDRLNLAMSECTHVIHAAAMKIVTSVDYNPFEAVKTNIIGTQNVIDCALANSNVEKVLGISSDKAVSPLNLYGTTKAMLEKLFIAANQIKGEYGPKFSVARYGNVSNSRGSVIPYFKKLLDNDSPLTITDVNMTRFWITLPEAAKFVLDRLSDMQGEEIFAPDMKSYKIIDLAKILLADRYYTRYGTWSENLFSTGISVIGNRGYEKVHEDLYTKYEFPFLEDKDGYSIITKNIVVNEENLAIINGPILKDAVGYNSSHNLMGPSELETLLIQTGLITVMVKNESVQNYNRV